MADATLKMLLLGEDRSASKALKGVGEQSSRTGGALKGMGKIAAGVFAGTAILEGAKAIGHQFVEMGKAAIEDQHSTALLAKQMQNNAHATKAQIGATEDWITAQGKAYGVADDDLRPALGRLVTATHSVTKARKLASLAENVSAGSGKSLKTVTDALAKAQTGSLGGLSRLGVATKDAAGKTKSLHEITKELAANYRGDAATAADTAQGKFKRLGVQFSEMRENIGYKLLPVASAFASFLLDKLGPALARVGDWVNRNVMPVLRDFGGFIVNTIVPAVRNFAEHVLSGLRDMFHNVGQSVQQNKPFLEALGQALLAIGKFVATKVIPALAVIIEHTLPLLGHAIGTSITVIAKLTGWFLKLGEWGVRAFAFLVDAALSTFSAILHAADKGLGWIPGIGDKIHNATEAFDNFKDNTVTALNVTANKLGEIHDKITAIKPKTVTIGIHYVQTGNGNVTVGQAGHGIGANAAGTSNWRGGLTWVGERGPELVNLPRGSAVYNAQASTRMTGVTNNFHIYGAVDKGAAAREIKKILNEDNRMSGKAPAF